MNVGLRARNASIAVCAVLGTYHLAYIISSIFVDGAIGFKVHAFFLDYLVWYAAAPAIKAGGLPLVFEPTAFTAFQNNLFAHWLPSPMKLPRPWLYPPTFLLVALPLSLVPVLVSALTFQLAGVLAVFFAFGKRVGATLALVASPAFCATFVAGQNSAFMLGFLVGGLRLLDSSPVLAGMMLGLLSLKPQLFVLVPVALLAARAWRALFAAIATALSLAILSVLYNGIGAWTLWLQATDGPLKLLQVSLMSKDAYGAQMGSILAAANSAGASVGVAWALQLIGAMCAGLAVTFVFARRTDLESRGVVIAAASLLASPYWMNYELLLPSGAIVLAMTKAWRDGFGEGEWLAWPVIWILPFTMVVLNIVEFPVAPLVVAATVALAVRQAIAPRSSAVLRAA